MVYYRKKFFFYVFVVQSAAQGCTIHLSSDVLIILWTPFQHKLWSNKRKPLEATCREVPEAFISVGMRCAQLKIKLRRRISLLALRCFCLAEHKKQDLLVCSPRKCVILELKKTQVSGKGF